MVNGPDTPPLFQIVDQRSDVMEGLIEEPADKRELESMLDVSRATVDRAIESLSDLNCIIYQDGRWDVTLTGKIAFEKYREVVREFENIEALEPLLRILPTKTQIDMRLLKKSDVILAEKPAPHAPITHLEELLNNSKSIKFLSSVILPKYVPTIHYHTIQRKANTSVILNGESVGYIWEHYPDEISDILEADNATICHIEEKIPYSLMMIDDEIVWVAVYDKDGSLKGSIINRYEHSVSWANEIFQDYHRGAERVMLRGGLPRSKISEPVT